MNDPEGLLKLWGFKDGRKVVVRTKRGVEIPLAKAKGWTVLELAELLQDIQYLPEVEESC